MQSTYWMEREYLINDFIFTSKNRIWKTYLSKKSRQKLSEEGYELVKGGLNDFKDKVTKFTDVGKDLFNRIDRTDFSSYSTQQLKDLMEELVKTAHLLIDAYFYTEFFCHDKIQSEVERLGLNTPDYLASSPLENFLTNEECERNKLALNPSESAINAFLAKFEVAPFRECKPAWDKDTLLENLKTLKNPAEKVKELEQAHEKIISNRKHHWLTDGVRVIQEQKFYTRVYFNKLYFKGNVMDKILTEVARRFDATLYKMHDYSCDEVVKLLAGEDLGSLPDRTYYVMGRWNDWQEINGQEAVNIMEGLESNTALSSTTLSGHIGNKGYVKGRVKIIPFDVNKDLTSMIANMKKGDILVSGSTGPEMILACKKAGAIVTEEGGICSHAAIVSRELGIPCVIGTKVATKVLKDGDLVEVDADNGVVKILERAR